MRRSTKRRAESVGDDDAEWEVEKVIGKRVKVKAATVWCVPCRGFADDCRRFAGEQSRIPPAVERLS